MKNTTVTFILLNTLQFSASSLNSTASVPGETPISIKVLITIHKSNILKCEVFVNFAVNRDPPHCEFYSGNVDLTILELLRGVLFVRRGEGGERGIGGWRGKGCGPLKWV